MIERSAFLLLATGLASLLAACWANPPFTTDSWGYYELSQALRHGGYALDHLRSFASTGEGQHSTAFPPLWPAIWAAGDLVAGLGVRTGLVIAFAITFGFAVVSEAIGRRLAGVRFVGLAAACFTVLLPGYFGEIAGARAIPLQLLIVAGILYRLTTRPTPGALDAAILGALAGAAILSRFDMLAFAILLGLALALHTRSVRPIAAYAAALVLALSPWIAISLVHHGVVFASDNSGVAFSADRLAYVNDWRPPGAIAATISTDPAGWLGKVAANVWPMAKALLKSPGKRATIALLVVAAACGWWLFRTRGLVKLHEPWKPAVVALALVFVAALGMVPLYVLVGYTDARYFSLLSWLAALGLFSLTGAAARQDIGASRQELLAVAFCGLLLAGALQARLWTPAGRSGTSGFPQMAAAQPIGACLAGGKVGPQARVLVTDSTLAARLSAMHGMRTALLPRNIERGGMAEADLALFLATFSIAALAGDAPTIERVFPSSMRWRVPGDCGLPLYLARSGVARFAADGLQ